MTIGNFIGQKAGPHLDGQILKDGKFLVICRLQSFPSGTKWGWFYYGRLEN